MLTYILDGHTPVAVTDGLRWARWIEAHKYRALRQEHFSTRPDPTGGPTPRSPVRGGPTPRSPVRGGPTPRSPVRGGPESEAHRELRLRRDPLAPGGVDRTRVGSTRYGEVWVSTVFLGIDHAFGDGPPLLFETMIFGGPLDQWQERCSTWEEAEYMHLDACALVRGRPRQPSVEPPDD